MRVAGELGITAGHVPVVQEELRPVGERVLDIVVIEVLIDAVAPITAAAGTLGLHRPGVFHPAAFVHVVCDHVLEQPAAGPEEA